MSFGFYLLVLTVVALALRWILFTLYEETDDGPSFLAFMFDPEHFAEDRFRVLMLVLLLGAGGIGLIYLD